MKKLNKQKLSLKHFKVNEVKNSSQLFGGNDTDSPDTVGPVKTKPRGVIK